VKSSAARPARPHARAPRPAAPRSPALPFPAASAPDQARTMGERRLGRRDYSLFARADEGIKALHAWAEGAGYAGGLLCMCACVCARACVLGTREEQWLPAG
jgi:hypothetical protein